MLPAVPIRVAKKILRILNFCGAGEIFEIGPFSRNLRRFGGGLARSATHPCWRPCFHLLPCSHHCVPDGKSKIFLIVAIHPSIDLYIVTKLLCLPSVSLNSSKGSTEKMMSGITWVGILCKMLDKPRTR